jgi:hypothetical protein
VVAVVFIVVILAGILLPVVGFERDHDFRPSQCGKNQSQILGAMVAYATSEETGWPDARAKSGSWKLPAGPIATAVDGARYTAGAFELIAASQSIPNGLFRCPSARVGGPDKTMNPSVNRTSVQWGWNPSAGIGVSYAFDWASPADPGSDRVILADRDTRAHNGYVMAVFGDAHVKKVKLVEIPQRPTGTLITEGIVASPTTTATGIQPDDDIYSTEGDAGEPLTSGKGDPRRAWVK